MLRNIQSQSLAGYTGNLSDQAKKRTGISPNASQPATPVQTPQITQTPYPGLTNPSSNLPSPSIPGTVNVAGKPTQMPMQSSGKSGGFNKGPVAPQPGIATTPGINPNVPTPITDRQDVPWTPPGPGDPRGIPTAQRTKIPGQNRQDSLPIDKGNISREDYIKKTVDDYMRKSGGRGLYGKQLGEDAGRWWDQGGQPIFHIMGSGVNSGQAGIATGQPMTLRDAFSTLQNAGYGNNILM